MFLVLYSPACLHKDFNRPAWFCIVLLGYVWTSMVSASLYVFVWSYSPVWSYTFFVCSFLVSQVRSSMALYEFVWSCVIHFGLEWFCMYFTVLYFILHGSVRSSMVPIQSCMFLHSSAFFCTIFCLGCKGFIFLHRY